LPAGEIEVDFLVNDLSFHGQFTDIASFRDAIGRIMIIRRVVRQFGWNLYCQRSIAQAQVTPTAKMPQAVQRLVPEERRALMQWLTQHGPFWEDLRNHGPDDWLECHGKIVTETAVGEAAWCCLNGVKRGLASLVPSNWLFSPVPVEWVLDVDSRRNVDVLNHWEPIAVEDSLRALPAPVLSWARLEVLATALCTRITFAPDAFAPLAGHPFVTSAAQRLLFIFETLNRFKSCFSADGQRTPEGHEIYQNHFTGRGGDGGRGALFCDSSDEEKENFRAELTFRHPTDERNTLFCPWHGKVQTPQLRVHFSWPVRADEPFYVVYVGPKITRR